MKNTQGCIAIPSESRLTPVQVVGMTFSPEQGISRSRQVFCCLESRHPRSGLHSRGRLHLVNDELQRQLPHLLPRLWRFALRLTRNQSDAEDLVQRCCLRALERRWQWRPGTAMLSWLFSIMHTIWLNEIRARQRRRESSLDWEDDSLALTADLEADDPSKALLYRQVVEAVEMLPEAQRLVVMLVDVEGLSYKETAEVLAVPIGTVMSRLARARSTVGQRFLGAAPEASGGMKGGVR